MWQGVGKAEQQKKQDRNDRIKQLSIQPPTGIFIHNMHIMKTDM